MPVLETRSILVLGIRSMLVLEILDSAFVFLGRRASIERAKILAFASLRIDFLGIEPVLA
jgi:hypothetical protein